jgi:NADH dehydrogenase [ubiquinone] 1 alpha subcomplex assembly factor 7
VNPPKINAPKINALEQELAAMIRMEGPIGIDRFMALALGHPRYGYYMTRDPLGVQGDFVTAPEISQMFGELLGLAAGMIWQSLGEPRRFALCELGPGRGTLMEDALRALKALPGCREAIEVHLVEMSPILKAAQQKTLADSGATPNWHLTIETLPRDCPLIILANEFFDALPVRQFKRDTMGWHERMVGLSESGQLVFGFSATPIAALTLPAPEGALFETSPIALDIQRRLAERITAQRGAMIAIDYGHHRSGFGETLQAVRQHHYVPVLSDPGEVDLTAHVDFATLAIAAHKGGAKTHPILTQATLLDRLGIGHRANLLKRNAENQGEIDAALARLSGKDAKSMGLLFKALAITSPGLPPPPGFDAPDPLLIHAIQPTSE